LLPAPGGAVGLRNHAHHLEVVFLNQRLEAGHGKFWRSEEYHAYHNVLPVLGFGGGCYGLTMSCSMPVRTICTKVRPGLRYIGWPLAPTNWKVPISVRIQRPS